MTATTRTPAPSTPSTDTSEGYTTLADRLRNDRPEDSRSCRRSDCPGSLSLVNHDEWGVELVICQLCRTTPQGKFIPPTDCQSSGSAGREGWGERLEERYPHSGKHRLPGGFEECYDENEDRRPNGLDDEYTWDLTTY